MQYVGVIIGYAFSFFSLGNSAYLQHQQLQLARQRAAQQQAQVMRCDPGLHPVVIDNHDGTYSVICEPIVR